jgi:hypothetical protein
MANRGPVLEELCVDFLTSLLGWNNCAFGLNFVFARYFILAPCAEHYSDDGISERSNLKSHEEILGSCHLKNLKTVK